MIVAWFIGVILSCLGIWLLKNSRYVSWKRSGKEEKEPVLKMWILILLMICTMIPIFNGIMGLIVIAYWAIEVLITRNWKVAGEGNKLVQFLKKPIK